MSVLFALILQTVTPGAAVAAANDADLRCLAVVAAMSGSAEAPSRAGLAAGAMYFVGKIDARSPGFDFDIELLKLVRSDADLPQTVRGVPPSSRRAPMLLSRSARGWRRLGVGRAA